MTIHIDTVEVDDTGNQFGTKRGELETLNQQANTLMNNLQGQFTGKRATAIFNEWNAMQPSLKEAVATLERASTLLKRAAADFLNTDNAV